MASRVTKHEHKMAVISHYDDWSRALAMCQAKPCALTVQLKPGRVKISDGPTGSIRARYRNETAEEWQQRVTTLPHLCCG